MRYFIVKVKIALEQRACAIAVRFDYEKRKIQVVDNSNGYTKCELASIFGEQNEVSIKLDKICKKIRSHSYAIIITSKHQSSSYTHVKVSFFFLLFQLLESQGFLH